MQSSIHDFFWGAWQQEKATTIAHDCIFEQHSRRCRLCAPCCGSRASFQKGLCGFLMKFGSKIIQPLCRMPQDGVCVLVPNFGCYLLGRIAGVFHNLLHTLGTAKDFLQHLTTYRSAIHGQTVEADHLCFCNFLVGRLNVRK